MTTSEQARADAIADAETLRLYAMDNYRDASLLNHELSVMYVAAALGMERGSVAAARAAFRAVPGLR